MGFEELATADVAIWGCGREGRAALVALRRRFPEKPLTLYCKREEALALQASETPSPPDPPLEGEGVPPHPSSSMLNIRIEPPDADALSAHEIVIKSPGISAYKPEIVAAQKRGTVFTSGTALWFGENPGARVIAVTGTKGKSTTAAMIAHCARSLGVRTALAGNIGMPLLELDGQHADLWAIELSSFQTGEAGPVEVGVIVSLEEEHLDWHGTRERYIADKLKLAGVSQTLVVNTQSRLLVQRTASHSHRILFEEAHGWHVGESAICRGSEHVLDLSELPLPGVHNARNACAALATLESSSLDARSAAPALRTFKPLPHRLQRLGVRNGIEWIDDSIATTPAASLAALRSVGDRAATLILGGFDRGLDWDGLSRELAAQPPHALIAQGANAARIIEALTRACVRAHVERADDFEDAVTRARGITPPGGVVLLSPGAPSFDRFKDYAERGRAFAMLAGFDAAALGEIEGLGIA